MAIGLISTRARTDLGISLVEYALILGLVVIGLLVFQGVFFSAIENQYEDDKESLNLSNMTMLGSG